MLVAELPKIILMLPNQTSCSKSPRHQQPELIRHSPCPCVWRAVDARSWPNRTKRRSQFHGRRPARGPQGLPNLGRLRDLPSLKWTQCSMEATSLLSGCFPLPGSFVYIYIYNIYLFIYLSIYLSTYLSCIQIHHTSVHTSMHPE